MPTIREQFEQAKADFAAAFKAGDAERAREAGELAEKYEAIVRMADEKGAKLNAGAPVRHSGARDTLGEWAAKSLDLSAFSGCSQASIVTAEGYKSAADTNTAPASAADYSTYLDKNIVPANRRRLQVRDLLGSESRDSAAVEWLVEGAIEGKPAVAKEGGTLSQYHFADPEKKTAALEKIGGFYRESYEIVTDQAWLASSINDRGLYLHDLTVEDKLISDLSATDGLQTATTKSAGLADAIFQAITNIGNATPFMADAVVLNPADYQTLRLTKDTNGQYLGGGYFSGQYGSQGGIVLYPDVWGLTTVVTSAVAAGSPWVGAFKASGSVFTRAGDGLRVEMTNSDKDDFEHDLVAIRVIERLKLVVRYPAGLEKLTISGA
jgi:HK97 family phage major capsid protein